MSDDQPKREMTLVEFVHTLHKGHKARQQLTDLFSDKEKAEAELADCGEELLQEQEANRNNCGNWNLQVDELKDELAECKKLLEFVDRIPCPNCKELEAERDRLKQDIKGIVNQNATLHIENQGLREALEKIADPNSYGTSPSEYREIARDALAGGISDRGSVCEKKT